MAKLFSVHSFRGGTGKTNTTADISFLLSEKGLRVGIIDTDIQSPGIHTLLGLKPEEMTYTLNDYLNGKCSRLSETAYDMTDKLGKSIDGRLFFVPSSMKAADIIRILREGYNINQLGEGYNELITDLELDVLMLDTHPGLNEETLMSIGVSDGVIFVMRPEQQDIQGIAVVIDVARKLDVGNMSLIVNNTPALFDSDQIRKDMQKAYGCEVSAVLFHSEEMMALGGRGIFALNYPDHPSTLKMKRIVQTLLEWRVKDRQDSMTDLTDVTQS